MAKSKLNTINPETIYNQIMDCASSQAILLGYDIENPKERRSITHNEVNYILRRIYDNLFKPDKPQKDNKKSILDYNDDYILQIVADAFLDICSWFNKSLGLMSFSYMTGISYTTIYNTMQGDGELNPERLKVLKSIQEGHKTAQISLLNDSPVGALAVANNDKETGLNWSANQIQQITNNTVYYLPSERTDKLGLEKLGN